MGSTGYNQTCVYHELMVCKLFFKTVFRFEVDSVIDICNAASHLYESQVVVSDSFNKFSNKNLVLKFIELGVFSNIFINEHS